MQWYCFVRSNHKERHTEHLPMCVQVRNSSSSWCNSIDEEALYTCKRNVRYVSFLMSQTGQSHTPHMTQVSYHYRGTGQDHIIGEDWKQLHTRQLSVGWLAKRYYGECLLSTENTHISWCQDLWRIVCVITWVEVTNEWHSRDPGQTHYLYW